MDADDQNVEAGITGTGSAKPPAGRSAFPPDAAAGTAATPGTMRAAVLDARDRRPPWPSANSPSRYRPPARCSSRSGVVPSSLAGTHAAESPRSQALGRKEP
jgi:hypothetical protein